MTNEPNTSQNNSPQSERHAMLRQDREATTFFAQAKLSEQLDGSRLKSSVIGTEASVHYPAAAGPWADPIGPGLEPFIDGTACGDVFGEGLGTAIEVQASIAQLAGLESSPQPEALTPERFPSEVIRDGVGAKPLRIRRVR
jgi:hypothetical protein